MALLVPSGIVTASAETQPVIQTTATIDREIDQVINRLLKIVMRRRCADFQTMAHDFLERKATHQELGQFAYLNDPYLRTLAIAGEAELCQVSSHRELETLFTLREEMLAHDATLGGQATEYETSLATAS